MGRELQRENRRKGADERKEQRLTTKNDLGFTDLTPKNAVESIRTGKAEPKYK